MGVWESKGRRVAEGGLGARVVGCARRALVGAKRALGARSQASRWSKLWQRRELAWPGLDWLGCGMDLLGFAWTLALARARCHVTLAFSSSVVERETRDRRPMTLPAWLLGCSLRLHCSLSDGASLFGDLLILDFARQHFEPTAGYCSLVSTCLSSAKLVVCSPHNRVHRRCWKA